MPILEYKSWVAVGVFLILFSLEHIWPSVKKPTGTPLNRLFKNILFWPINMSLSLLIILPLSAFAAQHHLWQRPSWFAGIGSVLVDILVLDFLIYWWHRAMHEIQFLWRFHEVHHLDEHLDTTSAIRFHFGEILFASVFRAVVIASLGIPFSSIVLFETLVLMCALFHHSNIKLPTKIETGLSKVIVTPSLHWVHHHALRKDTDSQYGTILSCWDRIFRTASKTTRTSAMPIGVEGLKDKQFVQLIRLPFSKRRTAKKTDSQKLKSMKLK